MLNIEQIRKHFPALNRTKNGKKVIYLDGPGGSQVVDKAIEAMVDYMSEGVANLHGEFPTSKELDVTETGGWIRAGLSPYNTDEEVELFIEAVKAFVIFSKKQILVDSVIN